MKSFEDLCTSFEDAETMLELAKEMDDEESMSYWGKSGKSGSKGGKSSKSSKSDGCETLCEL